MRLEAHDTSHPPDRKTHTAAELGRVGLSAEVCEVDIERWPASAEATECDARPERETAVAEVAVHLVVSLGRKTARWVTSLRMRHGQLRTGASTSKCPAKTPVPGVSDKFGEKGHGLGDR